MWSKFTMDSLFFSRSPYKIPIFSMNSLWFNYPIREFTINSLSFTRIHNESIPFFVNSLWVHYFSREIPLNSLSSPEFATISLSNSLWFHYQLREFAINPLFSSPKHNILHIEDAKSLWIHYQLVLIHSLTRELTLISLSVMQIHYEFVTFLANLLWVHYSYANSFFR